MKSCSPGSRAALCIGLLCFSRLSAQVVLTGSQYLQDFNSLGAGLPEGWTVRTGAGATSLGNVVATAPAVASWTDAGGAFKNVAATTGLATGVTSATQALSADRALGIRQVGAFGDPGAAFVFNFSTASKAVTSVSLDLLMLGVNPRSTTWTIDYGIGAAPTAFTSLGTWSDPGAFGVTSLSFTSQLAALENQDSVFLRVVALGESTGTGSRDTMAINQLALTFTSGAASVSRGGSTVFTPGSFGGNAFAANNIALFDGAPATVSLSGNVVAAGLNFVTTGHVLIGGGTNSIEPGPRITVAGGGVAEIGARIAGTSSIDKMGEGKLILSGANSFIGNVTIRAGELEIGTDVALGETSNDVTLGGTLNVLLDLALDVGRDFFGTGAIAVPAARTLTVNGNAAFGGLTLPGSGKVVLAGASNTAASVTFSQPGTLHLTGGPLGLGGALVSQATSGTTTLSGGINFGTGGDRAVTVASGGTLVLVGPVQLGGAGRLNKGGGGVLDLTAADTLGVGAMPLGTQGTAPVDGGTLRIIADSTLGSSASQFHFNSGTLQITEPVISAAGVSIGGRNNNGIPVPAFSGGSIVFRAPASLFRAGGTTGEIAFAVNNTTTFEAGVAPTTGAGTATQVRVGGTGTLIVTGNEFSNDSVYDLPWIADGATIRLQMLGNSYNTFTDSGGFGVVGGGRTIGSLDARGTLVFGSSAGGGVVFNELTLRNGSNLTFRIDPGASPATAALRVTDALTTDANGTVTINILNDALAAQNGNYTVMSFVGAALGNISATTFVKGNVPDGEITYALIFDAVNKSLLLNVSGAAIPEPTTVALLVGAAGLCVAACRRRQAATAADATMA